MKLAIVISHPIQYMVPFFQRLAKEPGIDVTLYYCWDFGVEKTYDPEFKKEVKWDIPLLEGYKYKFLKNYSGNPSSGFWGQINPGIVPELAKGKYDAVLIFGWNSITNWIIFLATLFLPVKLFLRGESPMHQEAMKSVLKRFIKRIILWPLFKKTSAFLYIGEQNKIFYKNYGVPDKKLFFVPYAVDNDRLIAASELFAPRRKALRAQWGIPENAFTVIFAGKLFEKKRPFVLLRAYEKLFVSSVNAKKPLALIFMGDGEQREMLESYTKEKGLGGVHFVGFRNQTEMPEIYTMADLFVLPSGLGETWGLVTNEAMCFKLPVIVSDVVGCGKDLIVPGENGYIVPLDNVEKLAEAIAKIYESDDSKKFGIRSFERIQGYSFSVGVKKVAAIGERFLAS